MPCRLKIVRNIVGNFTEEAVLARHNTSLFSERKKEKKKKKTKML